MIDTITFWVFVGIWPIWLVWELVLLRLRGVPSVSRPKLISGVARDLGFKSATVVYLWGGLATHFWWPGKLWFTVPGAIIFWVLPVGLLIEDILLWKKPRADWPMWLKVQRFPLLVLLFGMAAGKVLFPQAMP